MVKVGGISKYYTELISHLKNYDVKVLLPVFLSNNYYLRDNESFMSVYRFCLLGIMYIEIKLLAE